MKTDEYFINSGVETSKIIRFRDVSDVDKVEAEDFRKKFNIERKKVFLYYGRIVKRKGLDLLIKGISKSKYKDSIFLLIAGDGDFKPDCERLAKSLLKGNYYFAGYVKPDEKYIYFSQSDVFVLPSIMENGTIEAWGLTVNEALLSNNFVICSNIVGSSYEIVTEKNGLIFEQNNLDELVSCIDKAYEYKKDEEFRKSVKVFSESYTYENMCADFLKAFNIIYK